MLTIGVYYYPEAWAESQWPRDMANIRKLGMEFVHVASCNFATLRTDWDQSAQDQSRPLS
jgi:hypothetical protein